MKRPLSKASVLPRPGPVALFLALVAGVLAVELAVVHTRSLASHPKLVGFGVTFDVTIVLPALYFWLIVRRRLAPAITVVPVLFLSLGAARLILPPTHREYLEWWKLALPIVELAVVAYFATQIRRLVRHYRTAKQETPYLNEALAIAMNRTFGEVLGLSFLVAEVTLMTYAVTGWFRRFQTPDRAMAFSYHRESGYGAILMLLVAFAIPPEMFAAHMLIAHWSGVAAWVWTALEAYGVLWLLGDFQAMRLHPFVLESERLRLRIGLRWRLDLDLRDIEAIEEAKEGDEVLKLTLHAAPTAVLVTREPVEVQGLLGLKRTTRRIGIALDDSEAFVSELRRRLR